MTDAAKPSARRGDLPFKHRIDVCQPQIGEADDAGANLGLPAAPVALLGNPPDELAFADRAHFLGAAGAIAGTALDEDGRDDVVPRIDVGHEVVEQIAAPRVVPEMMVRVDDRQPRFEDLFGEPLEPCRIGQRAGIGAGFDWHGGSPIAGGACSAKSTAKSSGGRRATRAASRPTSACAGCVPVKAFPDLARQNERRSARWTSA